MLFAIEVALAALLQGISPDFLIGLRWRDHGSTFWPEVLSLTDAAGFGGCPRQVDGRLPAGGVMVVVAPAKVLPVLVDGANREGSSAPHSVVVSGCGAAVRRYCRSLFARRGRPVHRLARYHMRFIRC